MSTSLPSRRVPEQEIQRIFNKHRYWQRAKAGEFRQVVVKERHPSLPAAGEPHCTYSQIVSYRDNYDNQIVLVHQYLRPDGELGASRKPDPKRILHDGVLYYV